MSRVATFFVAFLASALGSRPSNPVNYTVFGLRPYEIPGLDNKDTADALGDVYFWYAGPGRA